MKIMLGHGQLNVLLWGHIIYEEGAINHPKKAAETDTGCKSWHTRSSIVLM